MISFPCDGRIWLLCGGPIDGLAAIVQLQLAEDPYSGQLFVFCDNRVKLLWWDGDRLCLFSKQLECGSFRMASR